MIHCGFALDLVNSRFASGKWQVARDGINQFAISAGAKHSMRAQFSTVCQMVFYLASARQSESQPQSLPRTGIKSVASLEQSRRVNKRGGAGRQLQSVSLVECCAACAWSASDSIWFLSIYA